MKALKTRIKAGIARVIALTHPKLTAAVLAGDMGGPQRRLKKWIAQNEFARLDAKGAGTSVQQALTQRWTADNLSVDYYDRYAKRFEKMFGGPHGQIVDWLKAHANTTDVRHVIEVGCGDGRALAAMAERIPEIKSWTGVDINAGIIARNQATYAERNDLEFVAADATEWLADHAGPGTLLMTFGGVMEYIAPETLMTWFELLAKKKGAGVLLLEPVDPKHDLATDPTSHIWGWEDTYSHNHRCLLERSGYHIVRAEEADFMKYRFIMMLATPATF